MERKVTQRLRELTIALLKTGVYCREHGSVGLARAPDLVQLQREPTCRADRDQIIRVAGLRCMLTSARLTHWLVPKRRRCSDCQIPHGFSTHCGDGNSCRWEWGNCCGHVDGPDRGSNGSNRGSTSD